MADYLEITALSESDARFFYRSQMRGVKKQSKKAINLANIS